MTPSLFFVFVLFVFVFFLYTENVFSFSYRKKSGCVFLYMKKLSLFVCAAVCVVYVCVVYVFALVFFLP